MILFAAIVYGSTDVPAPINAAPGSIDQELIVNAVPTHVREWRLSLGLDESADFYRRYLGEHHVEFKAPHGIILAAPRAQRFVTVELQSLSARQTRARVSEANINAASPGSGVVPLPPDVTVLTRVGSRDGKLQTQTLIASSPTGLAPNADFFKRRLTTFGLRLSDRQTINGSGRQGEIMAFSAGARSIDIVMTREHGRTWISVMSKEPRP